MCSNHRILLLLLYVGVAVMLTITSDVMIIKKWTKLNSVLYLVPLWCDKFKNLILISSYKLNVYFDKFSMFCLII